MTETEWKRIKETNFDEMLKLQEDKTHRKNLEYLATDFESITLNGKQCDSNWLQNVYYIATQNVMDKAVTSFLCELDDSETMQQLADILCDIAAVQRKKTDFKAVISAELRRRKQQEKANEKERRLMERQAFLATQPEYYGGKLTQAVVEEILAENNITVKLNLVTKKIELHGYGTEIIHEQYSKDNIMSTLPTMILDICKNKEVGSGQASISAINAYLFNIADSNRYNPIQEMLEKHENDNSAHLDTIYEILGLKSEYDKMLVKKWLIQTVAFAYGSFDNPVSTEGVLVLQGEQGNGKTSFFRKLAGNPLWFTEGAVIDMRNKDSLITAISGWICELGEIDSTLKKEQSALKAFITRTIDKIRLPYAAAESDMPRTTSMCGTVNPEQFLKDTTGNRRYWTIHIDNIDKHRLHALTEKDIFDLWGYIYHLYLQDKNGFRLNDVEFKQLEINNRDFSANLPYEEEIRELLNFCIPKENWSWVSPAQLVGYVSKASAEQIGRVLSKIDKEERDVSKKRNCTGFKYLLPLKNRISNQLSNRYTS